MKTKFKNKYLEKFKIKASKIFKEKFKKIKFKIFVGRRRGIRVHLPRGQELWHTETRGHDVFKVYSKYKADPPDNNQIVSANHPHFVFRKVIVKGRRF